MKRTHAQWRIIKNLPGAGSSRALVLIMALVCLGPLLQSRAQAEGSPAETIIASSQRTYSSEFRPDRQKRISAETEEWLMALSSHQECRGCPSGESFHLKIENKRERRIDEFTLINETAQIDEAHIVGTSRAAVIGRALPNTSIVNLLDLSKATLLDSFFCHLPSVSPDSRFLAYVKFAPAHFVRWVSSEYLVYDLTGTPEANRSGRARVPTSDRYNVGIPVYPQGSLNRPGDNILTDQALTHAVSSDGFFWLDQSRFAFVDRWQGVNRLVVVDLRDGINQARVRVKPIETSDIVDLSLCKDADPIDFDRWSEDPAILMYVVNIRKSQAKIGFLTLDFNPTSPCLRRTSLDVALNWSLAD